MAADNSIRTSTQWSVCSHLRQFWARGQYYLSLQVFSFHTTSVTASEQTWYNNPKHQQTPTGWFVWVPVLTWVKTQRKTVAQSFRFVLRKYFQKVKIHKNNRNRCNKTSMWHSWFEQASPIPASPISKVVQFLAAPLPIQLTVNAPGEAADS